MLLLLSNRSPPDGVTEYLDQCNFRRDPAEVAQVTSLMKWFRTRNRRRKGGGKGKGKGAPDADDADAPDRFVGVEDDHISVSSADSLGSLGHLVVDVDTMSDAPPPPRFCFKRKMNSVCLPVTRRRGQCSKNNPPPPCLTIG